MGGAICKANDRKRNEEKKEKSDNNGCEENVHKNNSLENKPKKNTPLNGDTKKHKTDKKKEHYSPNKVTIDTNLLVARNIYNIKNNYKRTKVLGEGSFGKVYLVKHKQLNIYFAMKIIKKTNKSENEENIMNEINILRKLDHPNIVKIKEFYITNNEYILVTEYCPEGELFYEIKNFAPFNETLTAWYMKQILSAVCFCHKLKIIHRDLKPENILISKKNKNGLNLIKIIDFGTAMFKNNTDKSLTGSLYYISPEVLSKDRKYTEKCDVWSCGIIMYILLTGIPPFNGDSDEEIINKIINGKIHMHRYPWPIISSEAKDLVKKLLNYDENVRLTAEEALKHPWFESHNAQSDDIDWIFKVKNPNKLLNNLTKYRSDNVLRSTVFAYLVHNNIQLNKVHEAIKLFNRIDKNGDGQISKEELCKGLEDFLKLSGRELQEKVDIIFNNIDADHNGYIEYEEFIRAAIDKEYFLSENFLRFAFEYFDRDKNGEITFKEVKQLFFQNDKNKNNSEAQKQIWKNFDDIDINGDGILSFDEFVKMFRKILKKV